MGTPVKAEYIAAEERKLRRGLPSELRSRLLRENGGEIVAGGREWVLFPVWDPTSRATIRRTANSISRETASARTWRGFPPHAIAVAEDGAGNLLIVPEGSDAIMLWDHETTRVSPVEVVWSRNVAEHRMARDAAEQPILLPLAGIINQDRSGRHAFLQERVAATRTVWSLCGPRGWASRTDSQGRTILPLFPDAATAALCAVNDWQGYEPRAVQGAAIFPWLADLHRANRKLAMFPSPNDIGIVTNPARFAEDLKRTMAVLPFLNEDDED